MESQSFNTQTKQSECGKEDPLEHSSKGLSLLHSSN